MGAMTTEEAYLYENIAKQIMPLREEVAQLRVMIAELKATESRAPSGQTELAGSVPISRTAWEYRTYNSHDDTVKYHLTYDREEALSHDQMSTPLKVTVL